MGYVQHFRNCSTCHIKSNRITSKTHLQKFLHLDYKSVGPGRRIGSVVVKGAIFFINKYGLGTYPFEQNHTCYPSIELLNHTMTLLSQRGHLVGGGDGKNRPHVFSYTWFSSYTTWDANLKLKNMIDIGILILPSGYFFPSIY